MSVRSELAIAVAVTAACGGGEIVAVPDAPGAGGGTVDASRPNLDGGAGGGTPSVRFVGRWDRSANPARPRANFSGSAIVARFDGTAATIELEVTSVQPAYFVATVDGGRPARFSLGPGRASRTLATGLPGGEHTVTVSLDTEGQYGYTRFIGFDFGGGTLLAPPVAPRRLEIVGDSITCGYGNLGTPTIEDASNNWSAPTCSFSTATESAYMAYGGVLGRLFDAETTSICWSGRGVYEDLAGNTDTPANPEMVSVYADALLGAGYNGVALHEVRYPSAEAPATPVEAVVVNLGTNDIGGATKRNGGSTTMPPSAPFAAAYLGLIGEIRAVSPDAHIFVTLGSMTGDPALAEYRTLLDGVIAASGDAKVHRIDLDVQDASRGVGCDWHPTQTEDARMASRLAVQMQPFLGVTPRAADPSPL